MPAPIATPGGYWASPSRGRLPDPSTLQRMAAGTRFESYNLTDFSSLITPHPACPSRNCGEVRSLGPQLTLAPASTPRRSLRLWSHRLEDSVAADPAHGRAPPLRCIIRAKKRNARYEMRGPEQRCMCRFRRQDRLGDGRRPKTTDRIGGADKPPRPSAADYHHGIEGIVRELRREPHRLRPNLPAAAPMGRALAAKAQHPARRISASTMM